MSSKRCPVITLASVILPLASVFLESAPAQACSPDQPEALQIDEQSSMDDTTPPSAVEVSRVESAFNDGGDCFAEHWSVDLFVSATDEMTASSSLGYLVLDPGETAPTKVSVGTYVEQSYSGGRIHLRLDADLEGEATVVVHAVDAGGNVGPGTDVVIPLEDEGGCSMGSHPGSSAPSWWLVAGLVAAGAVGRRRSRRPSTDGSRR